jgi:hypothetical protein
VTVRNVAMTLLAIIIVLELVYYLFFLMPPNEADLTMEVLNNEAQMQRILEEELEELQYGDERRTRFKYIMGGTVIVGVILASGLPNRKL